MTNGMITRMLRIHGKVQGVTFRASAKREADQLGLSGWIRNNKDGTVSCEVCGPKEDVEKFAKWCKEGPRFAQVEDIQNKAVSKECQFNSFEIRY